MQAGALYGLVLIVQYQVAVASSPKDKVQWPKADTFVKESCRLNVQIILLSCTVVNAFHQWYSRLRQSYTDDGDKANTAFFFESACVFLFNQ